MDCNKRRVKIYFLGLSILVLAFFLSGPFFFFGCDVSPGEEPGEEVREEENDGILWPSMDGEEEREIAPELGCLAPDFTLKDLEGEKHTLSNYRGKGLITYFWAAPSPGSKGDMALLEELDQPREDLKVLVLVRENNIETVEEYLKGEGISLTVLVDEKGEVFDEYQVEGETTSFAINVQRLIRNIHRGYLGEAGIEKMRKSALGQFELDPIIK